ncbi:MAG: carboxypeptidase-like regulatory domain-containing protein, partial [bacterium]
MSRALPLFFVAFLSSFLAFSQNQGFQVNGRLTDSLGNPVARATISVYVEGQKDTLKTISNNVGFFLIKGIKENKFVLVTSAVGFGTSKKTYTIPSTEEVLTLGNVIVFPEYSTLKEILVSTPPIIVKEDTVEYKADSFRLKPNAMAEDLLKKMPGIEVDKQGNITAQGKTVSRVRVNGKDFFSG